MKTCLKTFNTSGYFLTKTFTAVLWFTTFISQHALGQLTDNFSDGDFTNSPAWTGSSSDFIINASNQLQLNSTVAGTSNLVVPFSFVALGDSEWKFNIRQTFSPSSTNFGRVYLLSDQSDLSSSLNGYYLQFGEAGSNDAVELFRQTGFSSQSVCRAATVGGIASAFNITVKVNRSSAGLWELRIDYTGGTNFVLEDTATDNTHVSSAYFGLRCTYTITNATKFFFDDFIISAAEAPDLVAPTISFLTIVSQTQVDVLFSEPLNSTAEVASNFSIESETVNPVMAILQGDQRTVRLTFETPFGNGVQQTLSVRNISDLASNILSPVQVNFLFFEPVPAAERDIVITEIFPDFSPAVGLPEAEFLEVYNRSQKPFDLLGWQITDGTSTGILSTKLLLPGEYLILCSTSSSSLFSSFGRTLGVSSFPSLNNAGDALSLKDPVGQTIDSVNYSSAWFTDDDKKDGGWTLERINPEDFCKESANWIASTNSIGGTPGQQNAVHTITPDVTGPKLLTVSLLTPNTFVLEFDEKLSSTILQPQNFSIEPTIEVLSVAFSDLSLSKIHLNLLTSPDSTVTYVIAAQNIYDCPGNIIQPDFSSFTLKLDAKQPEVKSLRVISSTSLEVIFSERVTKASAENSANYEVTNFPFAATATLSTDQKTVALAFANAFVNGVTNTLRISNILDLANNGLIVQEKDFTFFAPVDAAFKDLIITEIFADPSPQRSLPESEFIEIYNRSNNPFDLNGWTISDGSTAATLIQRIILPGTYLIICPISKTPNFSPYGSTLGATIFPSLNNTGDALILSDPSGAMIDSLNYSDDWYNDDEKKDGGWTLELIDPMNICSESANWTSSEHDSGGTPGKQNSVFAAKPDLTGPKLFAAIPLSSRLIELTFDEKLEKDIPAIDVFMISPSVTVTDVDFADSSLKILLLTLEQHLVNGIEYELVVNRIFDCSGNEIPNDHRVIKFALPEEADSLDLVVNEILFNPRPTGVDFVEVHNRSQKFINLKNFSLGNQDSEGNFINKKIVTEQDFLLRPGQYIVFTSEGNVLKGEYLQGKEETFFKMDLPSFPDGEGSVVLVSAEGKTIDSFFYSDQMHSVFIKDDEGVSLERINAIFGVTNEAENWKSASSMSGYATPGYLNSNAVPAMITDEAVTIEPEIFMPIYGQPDFAQIGYRFDQGGYVANVKIFDPHGREIKQLANNQTLGTEGFFRWDGDQDQGGKARIGSYMVWFEVFDEKGRVRTFRKRVVVADKF